MSPVQDSTPEPLGPLPVPASAGVLRSVLHDSAQYALGGLAYKAVALLSVPILARLLVPEDLGMLDLAVVVALVVAISGAVGLENALARLDAERPGSPRVWGSAGLLLVLGVACVGGAGLLFSTPLAALLLGSSRNAGVISSGVVYGCVLAFSTMGLNAVRLQRKPRRYALYGFLIVTAEMATALALAAAGATVPVIVLGWAAASALGAAVLILREVPRMGPPSTALVRRLARFGLPLVPAGLVWIIGDLGVRALLAHEEGLTALGLYGVAGRLTSVIQLMVVGFGLAWHPFLYRATGAQARHLGQAAAVGLVAGLGGLATILTALSPEVVAIVAGAGYEDAVTLVGGLSAAMVLFGVITAATAVLGVRFAVRSVALASAGGAAFQVLLAAIVVPPLGLGGAGVAVAVGYGITAALLVWRAGLMSIPLAVTTMAVAAGLIVTAVTVHAAIPMRLGSLALALLSVGGAWFMVRDRPQEAR